MSKVVKCMCEECEYNEGFECKADGIEVQSTAVGNVVTNWAGTGCVTFKNDGRTRDDAYNLIR